MIIRIAHREHPYVQVDRRAAHDPRLSLKARGLLLTLLGYPPHWEINVKHLLTTMPDGRDGLYAALHELRKKGYAEQMDIRRADGTFQGHDWKVWEWPEEQQPQSDHPDPDVPDPDNPPLSNMDLEQKDPDPEDVSRTPEDPCPAPAAALAQEAAQREPPEPAGDPPVDSEPAVSPVALPADEDTAVSDEVPAAPLATPPAGPGEVAGSPTPGASPRRLDLARLPAFATPEVVARLWEARGQALLRAWGLRVVAEAATVYH